MDETRTMVFYESPYRLLKTISDLMEICGSERQASVSREISKVYEETVRGTLEEIKSYYETHPLKGEFVICVQGLG